MTKKHFIAMADMVRNARKYNPTGWRNGEIRELVEFFRSQNPRFNSGLWLDYMEGKCGPNGGKLK